jgi:hypothetical protein
VTPRRQAMWTSATFDTSERPDRFGRPRLHAAEDIRRALSGVGESQARIAASLLG